jgi:hypothetical protein
MRRYSFIAAVFTLALCGCNRVDTPDNSKKLFNPVSEAPVCAFNVSASLDAQDTKALTLGENTASSLFADTDSVYVFIEGQRGVNKIIACGLEFENNTEGKMASLTISNVSGSTCDLSGALKFYFFENGNYSPFTPEVNDIVYLSYNMLGVHSPNPDNDYELSSFHYDQQTASKDGYVDTQGYGDPENYLWGANHFDFEEAKMRITDVAGDAESGFTLTLVQYADASKSDVSFKNQQSMFRQRLSFTQGPGGEGSTSPTITKLTISQGDNKVVLGYYPFGMSRQYEYGKIVIMNPVITEGDVFFALMFNEENKSESLTLTAQDALGNVYSVIKPAPAGGFSNGKYYYGDAELAWKYHCTDLSSLTGDYTVNDGEVLTGVLSGKYKISIANNATVTLADVEIVGENDDECVWAGINCIGNATIILADGSTNTVKGFYEKFPGIWIRKDFTLTISGTTGSLDASSNGSGAGIGGGSITTFGNIRIEGGNITATGGSGCAGIGAGGWGCGDITITGGTIKATGYKGGAGIGGGCSDDASCGTITISGGTIIASSDENGAGIGSGGVYGICEDIIISGGTITATGGENGAGIGAGNTGTCGDITISNGSVTATGGIDGAGIGIGYDAECGNISISGGTIKATGIRNGAGIGCSGRGKCGTIEITSGVAQVTATRGNVSTHSIGFGLVSGDESYITCGSVSIGGTVYWDGSVYQNNGNSYLSASPFIYPAP